MRALACWLALGLASACASTPPETHYYQLVVLHPPKPTPPSGDITLVIEPLAVDGAYATERIVYRRSRYRLDYYHYHRWSAPPALALAEYLRQAYARTSLFALVSVEPTAAPRTATLRGRILALEEVDESEMRWLGRVALELALFDPATDQPLWSATFLEEEVLPERTPEGLARAISVALERIVHQSSGAMARAAAGRPMPTDAGDPDHRPTSE